MTRVFLHVGAPKTATTYLQSRLALNRDTLAQHGYSYPAVKVGDVDHFRPTLDLLGMDWQGTIDASGQWASLVRKVSRAKGSAIISHELLSGARPDGVAAAMASLSGHEIHVVYSARDLGRQVPAAWQESIKQGKTWSFGRYLKRLKKRPEMFFWRSQNLQDVLTRWGADLPPERLHLVTVPPPGSSSSILFERLCTALQIDPAWLPTVSTARSNPSMGIAETAVIRELNKRLVDAHLSRDQHARLVKNVVAQNALAHRSGMTMARLPDDFTEWARELTAEWIDWARGSGIDVVGDLDDLMPAPSGGEPWINPDRPKPRQLADAAIDGLVAATLESARLSSSQRLTSTVDRVSRRLRGG